MNKAEHEREIVALYESGLGYEAIARKLDCGVTHVRGVIVRSGIPRRTAAEQLRLGNQQRAARLGGNGRGALRVARSGVATYSDLPQHRRAGR